MKLISAVFFAFCLMVIVSQPVSADCGCEKAKAAQAADSKEPATERKLLPGEKVITETGQELKVWSTRGPVPVSRAPEPFEDREKTVIRDSHIIVDAENIRRDRKDKLKDVKDAKDSFNIGEPKKPAIPKVR